MGIVLQECAVEPYLTAGPVVATGPPDTLGGRDHGMTTVRFVLPDGVGPADLPLPAGVEPRLRAGSIESAVPEPTAALHALTGWAIDRGVGLAGLTVQRPTLEDVYLSLTGGPGTDRAGLGVAGPVPGEAP